MTKTHNQPSHIHPNLAPPKTSSPSLPTLSPSPYPSAPIPSPKSPLSSNPYFFIPCPSGWTGNNRIWKRLEWWLDAGLFGDTLNGNLGMGNYWGFLEIDIVPLSSCNEIYRNTRYFRHFKFCRKVRFLPPFQGISPRKREFSFGWSEFP